MVVQIWELTAKILVSVATNLEWDGAYYFDRLFCTFGVPVVSLRSEAAGLLSILQKAKERHNGRLQLMIFTECLVLLLILLKLGHSYLWSVPGDGLVHFDLIFSLIQSLGDGQKE